MVVLLRSQTKPLLSVFALMSAWIANLLFAGGVAGILTLTPAYGYWDDYDFKIAVFVLISGTIMYSIYTLFYTLAMMVDNMKNEEKDIDEEAQEEGDDVEEANVDDNSASEAEEGKKQGGDIVESNNVGDEHSASSAEC